MPNEMTGQRLTVQEAWRLQYRQNRYARHLTKQELDRRIKEIILNMMLLTPKAQIGLLPVAGDGNVWMQKFTHVLEEMALRHGRYPAGFSRDIFHSGPDQFPNFVSELAAKAAARMSELDLKPGDVFLKFGKPEHMANLLERGALRIQPASFFASKDHIGAVRDDELTLDISLPLSRDDVVKLVMNPQDVPQVIPDQRFDFAFRSPTDYWLFCVTTSVQPRLFVDFNAMACVIIRDRKQFTSMLRKASSAAIAGSKMTNAAAEYIDPLVPTSAKVFVPFAKPFGYSYQAEHRFCWLPAQPADKLSHIDIELGSLKDFADLIVL